MNKKILILLSSLTILLFLAGCAVATAGPAIRIQPADFNFGNVDPAGGVQHTEFTVTNVGSEDLEILNISTSCGCTTGTMDKKLLKPGENAKLSVDFDPEMHIGEPPGDIYHIVYVQSNDPQNEEVEAEIRAFIQP